MLKERIQEVFEFTKSESPYRKANKGWINQDIFLDLSPSSDNFKQKKEAAKVTLLWSPINSLLSNIFLILIIGSILVFTSLSFAKGRFDFDLFNTSVINDIVKIEDYKVLKTSHLDGLDSINKEIEQSLEENEIYKRSNINSLDDNQINLDHEIITNKIDKQEIAIKDIERNKDIDNPKDQKSKSNFI